MSSKIKNFLIKSKKLEAFEEEIIILLQKKCTVKEIQEYLQEEEDYSVSINTLSNFIRTRNLRKRAVFHIQRKDSTC